MRRPLVLAVDDELAVVKLIRRSLLSEGFEVLTATDAFEALQIFEKELPDMVILDIKMPKIDGFEVCRRLREWTQIPIIMLSAVAETSYKVRSLNLGADDYITKPFSPDELIARVRSVLRRTRNPAVIPTPSCVTKGYITIDLAQRKVTLAGNELKLTPTEYVLLQELMTNAGKVLTHGHLLSRVWGPEYVEEREYLHVFVNRLRTKIEPAPANPAYIVTVPGVGYMLKDVQ